MSTEQIPEVPSQVCPLQLHSQIFLVRTTFSLTKIPSLHNILGVKDIYRQLQEYGSRDTLPGLIECFVHKGGYLAKRFSRGLPLDVRFNKRLLIDILECTAPF
jgi:hypothetical protein